MITEKNRKSYKKGECLIRTAGKQCNVFRIFQKDLRRSFFFYRLERTLLACGRRGSLLKEIGQAVWREKGDGQIFYGAREGI